MKKRFDIRKSFELFLKEPLSILTEGLFQIVSIQTGTEFKNKTFSVDFINNKTQLTVVNNEKMCSFLQTVIYKSKVKAIKEKAVSGK